MITNTVLHTIGKDFLEVSTSSRDLLSEQAVLTYPNPSKDIFNIEINNENYLPGILKIFDISGNLVRLIELTESKQTIDLGAEYGGMYFYKIEHNGASVAEGKLMKF